jgi:thymidylate synthase
VIIEANNVAELWLHLFDELYHAPSLSSPRGKPTRELLGVQLYLDDLRNNILVCDSRNLNYRFMVAEWLWIALGREDVAGIARYNKFIAQYSDDGVKFAGAYGPRLVTQWQWLIKKFEGDGDSRQAVASIWTPNPAGSRDIPCTLSLQFLWRDDRLNCIATMRSSDVWLGLPYDLFNFSMLTNALAGELGVKTGWLKMNLGSSHLYDENYPTQKIWTASYLRSPQLEIMPGPWLNYCLDGEWNFPERDDQYGKYARVLSCKNRQTALEVLRDISAHA